MFSVKIIAKGKYAPIFLFFDWMKKQKKIYSVISQFLYKYASVSVLMNVC